MTHAGSLTEEAENDQAGTDNCIVSIPMATARAVVLSLSSGVDRMACSLPDIVRVRAERKKASS